MLFIWDAYCFSQDAHAGQMRQSGQPYFTHCASVGVILSQWKMDSRTIAAGLLHDIFEDTKSVILNDLDASRQMLHFLNLEIENLSRINSVDSFVKETVIPSN